LFWERISDRAEKKFRRDGGSIVSLLILVRRRKRRLHRNSFHLGRRKRKTRESGSCGGQLPKNCR